MDCAVHGPLLYSFDHLHYAKTPDYINYLRYLQHVSHGADRDLPPFSRLFLSICLLLKITIPRKEAFCIALFGRLLPRDCASDCKSGSSVFMEEDVGRYFNKWPLSLGH